HHQSALLANHDAAERPGAPGARRGVWAILHRSLCRLHRRPFLLRPCRHVASLTFHALALCPGDTPVAIRLEAYIEAIVPGADNETRGNRSLIHVLHRLIMQPLHTLALVRWRRVVPLTVQLAGDVLIRLPCDAHITDDGQRRKEIRVRLIVAPVILIQFATL